MFKRIDRALVFLSPGTDDTCEAWDVRLHDCGVTFRGAEDPNAPDVFYPMYAINRIVWGK